MARQVIGHVVVSERSGVRGVVLSEDRYSHTYTEIDPETGRLVFYEMDSEGNYVAEDDHVENALEGRITRIVHVVGEEPNENLPSLGRLYPSAKAKALAVDDSYHVVDDGDSARLVRKTPQS